MEQRVRDLIESLQKFDPDIRVYEDTIVEFKYDGLKTRLQVIASSEAQDHKVAVVMDKNNELEERVGDLEAEIKDLKFNEEKLQSRIDEQASEIRSYCRSLEVIRDAIP